MDGQDEQDVRMEGQQEGGDELGAASPQPNGATTDSADDADGGGEVDAKGGYRGYRGCLGNGNC